MTSRIIYATRVSGQDFTSLENLIQSKSHLYRSIYLYSKANYNFMDRIRRSNEQDPFIDLPNLAKSLTILIGRQVLITVLHIRWHPQKAFGVITKLPIDYMYHAGFQFMSSVSISGWPSQN
jgi:hypothetical protein